MVCDWYCAHLGQYLTGLAFFPLKVSLLVLLHLDINDSIGS